MDSLRLLQFADLHLGRPFAWLPSERREQRRRDQQSALEQAIRRAIEREAHAILVPGDLFDDVPVDTASITFAVRAFAVAGCPPVFIAPGNHDPASRDNAAWNARLLQARGTHWPSHVHVFDQPKWSALPLARVPGVRIWGRAFLNGTSTKERPLAKDTLAGAYEPEQGTLDIAVFHGSREGRCPPSQKITAPFSDAEVAASPFHYHAAGHYHVRSEFEEAAGSGAVSSGVRLAYSGSPVALDHTEVGEHGALEVLVRRDGERCVVSVEPIALDRRRVLAAEADVTGCTTPEQVDERIQHALSAAGVTEHDLVRVRLFGRLPAGVHWSAPGADVLARAFHVRWEQGEVRPDHDLDALRAGSGRTTEERFALDLLARMEAEKDPEKRAVLERALYYGLDAFRLREVSPRWEEVART